MIQAMEATRNDAAIVGAPLGQIETHSHEFRTMGHDRPDPLAVQDISIAMGQYRLFSACPTTNNLVNRPEDEVLCWTSGF
jgi:hypothetical protein